MHPTLPCATRIRALRVLRQANTLAGELVQVARTNGRTQSGRLEGRPMCADAIVLDGAETIALDDVESIVRDPFGDHRFDAFDDIELRVILRALDELELGDGELGDSTRARLAAAATIADTRKLMRARDAASDA